MNISNIYDYIDEHLDEKIGLKSLSLFLNLTPQYLANYIKKETGKTFKELLNEKRSSSLGSKSAKTFNITVPFEGIDKFTLPSFWNKLINLGYASYLDNAYFYELLKKMQDEIGFSYGRICRIFDIISTYTIESRTIYDYTLLFKIFDSMIDNNLMPFIELGNKQLNINLSFADYKNDAFMSDSTEYYSSIIEKLPDFLYSCINRYGLNICNKWNFEISYHYTRSDDDMKEFSMYNYARFYKKVHDIIQEVGLTCKIGGPGFNDWSEPKNVHAILSYLERENVCPDFFTTYLYPLVIENNRLSLSLDENLINKRLTLFCDTLKSKYANIEIWVTEFNSNLSSRNTLNDSAYQGVFLIKQMISCAHLNISALGYYLLTDSALRYVDSNDILFGGWGLFSDKNIPKPSYFAYYLFSKLMEDVIEQGDNYIITSNSITSISGLFFHYDHFKKKYTEHNVHPSDLDTYENVFNSTPARTYNIVFNSPPKGTYLIKEYTVSNCKSSILYNWSKINYLPTLSKTDLDILKETANLDVNMKITQVKEDCPLLISVHVEALEFKLIEIDLQ
ncbi:MAG: hypothetical protein LBM02_03870 [Lachnospiraceae bacterium]|nr:hypothetical protein [Lachnospiraceae bacterium]